MFRYIENRLARTFVHSVGKFAKFLSIFSQWLECKKDRGDSIGYFIRTNKNQYLIRCRKKKYRVGYKRALTALEKYEQADNPFANKSDFKADTFNQLHLGFVSFYREAKTGRYVWDTPQRDRG